MRLMIDLGLLDGSSKKERLSCKFQGCLRKQQLDVDHNTSEHTMVVQRAGWLKIDTDISNQNLFNLAPKILKNRSTDK